MSDDGITTAEIEQVVPFSGPARWALRVITNRSVATRGLTKGKSAPLLVADTLPELLRHAALVAEANGGTLDGIADAMRNPQR